MAFLLDTNVLLRWVNPARPDHEVARRAVHALKRRHEDLYVTPQNLVEFWNVLTRPPEGNGLGLKPDMASEELDRVKAFFGFTPDSPEIFPAWERLVIAHGVSGVQVHDARLAAFMQVYGIPNILTFNDRHFRRFPFLTAVSPHALV